MSNQTDVGRSPVPGSGAREPSQSPLSRPSASPPNAIDWQKPLQTKHAPRKTGILQSVVPHETRRRVLIGTGSSSTVFLYSEDGICRVDGQPGPMDLENGGAR